MNSNVMIDGLLANQTDFFPSKVNNFDYTDKINIPTTNPDGYNAHPIDLFFSNNNKANNDLIPNLQNIPTYNNNINSNMDFVQYQQNLEEKDGYNPNQKIRESYEPNMSVENDDIPLNNNQIFPSNMNNYQNPNQFNYYPNINNEISSVNLPVETNQISNGLIINQENNNNTELNISYVPTIINNMDNVNYNNMNNINNNIDNNFNDNNFNNNIVYLNDTNNLGNENQMIHFNINDNPLMNTDIPNSVSTNLNSIQRNPIINNNINYAEFHPKSYNYDQFNNINKTSNPEIIYNNNFSNLNDNINNNQIYEVQNQIPIVNQGLDNVQFPYANTQVNEMNNVNIVNFPIIPVQKMPNKILNPNNNINVYNNVQSTTKTIPIISHTNMNANVTTAPQIFTFYNNNIKNNEKIPIENNMMKAPPYSVGTYEPDTPILEYGTRLETIKSYLEPQVPKYNTPIINNQTNNYTINNQVNPIISKNIAFVVPNQPIKVVQKPQTIVVPVPKTIILPKTKSIIVPTQKTINVSSIKQARVVPIPIQKSVVIPNNVIVHPQTKIVSPRLNRFNSPVVSNQTIQSMMINNAYNPPNMITLPSSSKVIVPSPITLINLPQTMQRTISYNVGYTNPLSQYPNRKIVHKSKEIAPKFYTLSNRKNSRKSKTPIKSYNL